MESGPGYCAKRLVIDPGQRLSLQLHQHRSEKWLVVRGSGSALVNGKTFSLNVGTVVDVPKGAIHRLQANPLTALIVVEVATGDDIREDDIQRLEDDYGRAGTAR